MINEGQIERVKKGPFGQGGILDGSSGSSGGGSA